MFNWYRKSLPEHIITSAPLKAWFPMIASTVNNGNDRLRKRNRRRHTRAPPSDARNRVLFKSKSFHTSWSYDHILIDWVRSGRMGKYLAGGQDVRTSHSVNKCIICSTYGNCKNLGVTWMTDSPCITYFAYAFSTNDPQNSFLWEEWTYSRCPSIVGSKSSMTTSVNSPCRQNRNLNMPWYLLVSCGFHSWSSMSGMIFTG